MGTFHALRELIARETGIALNDGKRNFVAARLQHRLRSLQLASYDEYYVYAKTHVEERQRLINAITTNKTSFYRESHHFEMLTNDLVPRLVERAKATGHRRVRIWSAGCSSGEEAYSIAMALHSALPEPDQWDVRILASDIDTDVLERAQAGIYSRDSISTVPEALRERYFEASHDGNVRISVLVRKWIVFRQINLTAAPWPIRSRFDAIFCRNVVIYFDQKHQRTLFSRFASMMDLDAVLVLGHSETLHWMPDMFAPLRNTTYRLIGASEQPPAAPRSDLLHRARRITVGQVFATRKPTVVRTLLGSCIAVCLYDPEQGVGGMNHFLLPAGRDDEPTSARFGVHAMELLINGIMRQGGERHRLQAKIFGGSHVIDTVSSSVPEKNIAFIRAFLATESIPIRAELLGGEAPLDVCMFTDTGRVLVRRLGISVARTIADAESRFMSKRLEKKPVDDTPGVILF